MCETGTSVSTCDIRAGLTLGVDTQSIAISQNALSWGNTVMSQWFIGGNLYSLLPANPLLVHSDFTPTLAGSQKRKGCRETGMGYEAKEMSGDGESAWDGGEG